MDFSYLLDLAKQNEEHAREAAQVKRYSTQVSASKKIPRSGVQSQAIQAFLAKKEQEEKKKKSDEIRKKEALLSLRAQDRKSNARVQAMLKRTKASNKAVLEDVKGALNSTITSNEQPDEDDYGYVSNEASAFYKKLINKYSVDEPISADKRKERPRTEQKKVKDLPNRTSEKRTSGKSYSNSSKERVPEKSESSSGKPSTKEKESKKAPPKPPEATLSFDQILKLAAAKQHQPIKVEKKVEVVEKKQPEEERPMTKKEREELMRRKQEEKERQLRKLARESEGSSKSNSSKPLTPAKTKVDSTLKASTSKDARKPNGVPNKPLDKSSSLAQKPTPAKSEPPQTKPVPPAAKGPVQSSSARPVISKGVMPSNAGKSPLPPPQGAKPSLKGKAVPPPRGTALGPNQPSRPFPPYRRDHSMERPVQSYKRSIESDEEYDSELDDFIDDGPDETEDYSKHIREIFGYDRSKYRRIVSDDEDECMESSFVQQMREERISTRIGIMEDLEEERLQREEEERKRKLAAKKAKTRK